MNKQEQWTPATEKGVMPRTIEALQRLEITDLLLNQLRSLCMGGFPEGQTMEQRAALERIGEALEIYRNFFYPPGPRQSDGTPRGHWPSMDRADEGYLRNAPSPDAAKEE